MFWKGKSEWKNPNKEFSTGKDGVIRILPPVTAAEIQAIEKERKAKNILLIAIPKEHMRRFHGIDDVKEIWEAIRTRKSKIDDLDIEEMNNKRQIAMIAITNERSSIRKTGRECTVKGTHDGKKKRTLLSTTHQEAVKQDKESDGLLKMDDGIVPIRENTLKYRRDKSCTHGNNTSSEKRTQLENLSSTQEQGRREGKAPMTEEEETQASRKTKEQILQEEAGLAKAIRLDALEKALKKEEEKVEEDKDDKPTKKTRNRRTQIARKGFHTHLDKDESEDSDEANEKDDSTSRRISKLYRIVIRKHGMNEPEDEFEKVLWEYLKNMFEEPLSIDSIWSLPGQQRFNLLEILKLAETHCFELGVCAKGLTSPEQTATVEMVFSQPWTCTFLVAKGLTTPELMANWKIIMLQFKNNSKDNAHKILKKLIMKTLKET
ncbi:hypothetical protein Tco_0849668 [Tanacetum coccineum]